MFCLLAERIMGHPRIESVSTWMNRGTQMEDEAVSFYELQRNLETAEVGLITNDAGSIGASPDRLVGEDGLLEIKVPAEHTHVSYLLKKAVDQTYYPQIQGQLWIAERKWVDILSYHPEMPPALIRVERDEPFIALLSVAVRDFSADLEKAATELVQRGWIKAAIEERERPTLQRSWPDAPQAPPAQRQAEAYAAYTKTQAEAPTASAGPTITDPQRKRMYAIAKQAGWTDEEMKRVLSQRYAVEHSKDVPKAKYEEICKMFQDGISKDIKPVDDSLFNQDAEPPREYPD